MAAADRRAERAAGPSDARIDLERRFAVHAGALRTAAAGLCRSSRATELEDLIQDTFERALRHFTAGRPPPANERAWLVSILRNVFIDRLRAARPAHESVDELPAPAPESAPEPLWARVSIDDVHAALAQIDPAHRAIFELHYLRKLRYAEVAETLGIPMNTVASRLHRARKAVRDALVAATAGQEDT